jgi:methyl-accepting chemotaxis protein
MLFALVLVIAGVPAKLFYDANAAGKPTKPTGNPMSWTSSIDQNMRYLVKATSYGEGTYNGYISNVNDSEEGLPAIAQQLDDMSGSVAEMDASLGQVLRITQAMTKDMKAMAAGSRRSAATMQGLQSDVEALSGTMAELYLSSDRLTKAMANISARADRIATERTGPARRQTSQMNSYLPENVPAAATTLDPDVAP